LKFRNLLDPLVLRGKIQQQQNHKTKATHKMSATVTYFPINGRAFSIRAALRYAKFDFADNRVPFKTFGMEFKHDNSKCPLGSLPVLNIPEGNFVQSTAIAKWAAKKSDLYPRDDDIAQLIVDETMESVNELTSKLPQDKDEAVKKAKREEFAKNVVPLYLNHLSARVQASGGPYILGKKFSIADLFVYGQLSGFYSGNFDYFEKDFIEKNFPVVHTLYLAIDANEITRAEVTHKV